MSGTWKCFECGEAHVGLPLAVATPHPCAVDGIPPAERAARVQFDPDMGLCVVDRGMAFVWGVVRIPLVGGPADEVGLTLWVEIQRADFFRMLDRWDVPDRASDPPVNGWLSEWMPAYPQMDRLPVVLHHQPPGMKPLVKLLPCDHPLFADQRDGVSLHRWSRIVAVSTPPG